MFKKIIAISSLILFSGFLIFGAINRTVNKDLLDNLGQPNSTFENEARGNGRSQQEKEDSILGSIFNNMTEDNNPRNGNGNPSRDNVNDGNLLNRSEQDPAYLETIQWITMETTIMRIDPGLLVLLTSEGTEMEVFGRPLSFALESGFSANPGEKLLLTGFYDHEIFEIGNIENLSSTQIIPIRDEYGRPLWSGRGRGQQGNG
ncbi:MAG: hypothetical protein JEZ06_09650 [Anaerolineaceae bacterium]|nr:hypothetical protein [Anaerolineaceae bacterium]